MTPTVVFDLDRVLVGGNVALLFVRGLLRRAPARALPLIVAAPLIALAATVGSLRPLCAWIIKWVAFGRRSVDVRDVAAVYREALAGSPQAAVTDALACLRSHRAAGDRVVVATAAETTLARGFLTALGLDDVEVVASTGSLRPRRAQWAHDASKVRLLRDRGYPPPWAAVYSDSASDLPLFAGTPRPVLVNGSKRTLRRVSRALGRAPEIRTWH